MEDFNLFTIELKLKRHKLAYQLADNGNTIKLGGIINLNSQIFYRIVGPALLGLFLIIFGVILKIGFLDIIGFILLLLSSYGAKVVKNQKNNNKNIKSIKNGQIEISSDKSLIILTKKQIKQYKIEIDLITNGQYEGKLDIQYDSNRITLLSIYDDNKQRIDEDLNYIKNFIELKLENV